MPENVAKELMAVVEAALPRLTALSEATVTHRPAPNQWTIKEVLGHLIDSAANNHQRFVRAQFVSELAFPKYEQNEWVQSQNYNAIEWPALIEFWRRYNCVLLTGNGQPPRGVRRLARRLHEEHRLPVYVLVDNDPWGYYIYSVVKQGSINLAFESQRMAIPKAKFIGLSSADPERYELPRNVGIKLNEKDIARAKELTNYQWFQKPAWQTEIKRMLTSGLKYELDALANKDFQYLTNTYLPRKLQEKDWLD